MSLDVYLNATAPVAKPRGSGIFIRWNGQTREVSRAVWDELNPGVEPVAVKPGEDETTCLYSANITHNLTAMADAAGLYGFLWRPEENGITHARELIKPLEAGLVRLMAEPERYRKHNPANGWGTYDLLVDFTQRYIDACKRHPDATVYACR
jgi:hypothetical protein